MKKAIFLVATFFFSFLIVLVYNAITLKSTQVLVEPAPAFPVSGRSVGNFSKAIQFATISEVLHPTGDSVFRELPNGIKAIADFEEFLKTTYPLMDSLLQKETINNYGLLYKWEGDKSAGDAGKLPVILMAHMDVVPVEKETLGEWEVPPFSGSVKNSFVYGRGTLDDKSGVIGICEAVEKLLSEKFKPGATIYIAFGFDEEIGGHQGAGKIAGFLKGKNITAGFVLDEGLSITEGIIPGIDQPVALIGLAEKGYVSFRLKVKCEGGHSSMPGKENAITILSEAILKLKENPFSPCITEPAGLFMKTIGAEMPFFKKIVFANQWLFEGVIISQFEKTPSGGALLRTTVSPTIFTSGVKENVIPTEAEAVINFRILPGETSKTVEEYVVKTIDDPRVEIESTGIVNEPSPVSDIESSGYRIIDKTIHEVFPGVIVSPSLVLGATDSQHFVSVSKNIFRFLPVRFQKDDLHRVHGINERISVEDFKNCIRFYYYLIKNISNSESLI